MRYVISIGAGLAVALGLFLLMHTLISGSQEFRRDDLGGGIVDFIRIREEEITRLKERVRPEEPPPPDEPPPPPELQLADQTKPPPVALNIEMPRITVPVSTVSCPPSWISCSDVMELAR